MHCNLHTRWKTGLANILLPFGSTNANENDQVEEMNRIWKVHNESIILPIDLPTISEFQKESNEAWDDSEIKAFGATELHMKQEIN